MTFSLDNMNSLLSFNIPVSYLVIFGLAFYFGWSMLSKITIAVKAVLGIFNLGMILGVFLAITGTTATGFAIAELNTGTVENMDQAELRRLLRSVSSDSQFETAIQYVKERESHVFSSQVAPEPRKNIIPFQLAGALLTGGICASILGLAFTINYWPTGTT
jgi:hypothetical protein